MTEERQDQLEADHNVSPAATQPEILTQESYKEALIEQLERVDFAELAKQDKKGTYFTSMQAVHICSTALIWPDLPTSMQTESLATVTEFAVTYPLTGRAPEPPMNLMELIEELPQSIVQAQRIVQAFSPTARDRSQVSALADYIPRIFNPDTIIRIDALLQTNLSQQDKKLMQLLARATEGPLQDLRNRGLCPGDVQPKETSIPLDEEAVKQLLHGDEKAFAEAKRIGITPETLIDSRTFFPFPTTFLEGVTAINIKHPEQLPQDLRRAYGYYDASEHSINIFAQQLTKNSRGFYEETGGHAFATEQEHAQNTIAHEMGHHAHSTLFSFEEKQAFLNAQQADYELNQHKHLNMYVASHAEASLSPEAETVAASFELIRRSPGLFSVIAPHLYATTVEAIITHTPEEDRDVRRLLIAATTEFDLENRLRDSQTSAAIRQQYFKHEDELLAAVRTVGTTVQSDVK
jgi:hypothetical protein